jgi:hypothetical protein
MAINLVRADAEKVAQFWKNILDDPKAENAMNDNNGNLWERAQGGNPDILYFAGNDAQNHTRVIRQPVPPGKTLFIAVNPVVITDFEVEAEAVPDKNLANNANKDEGSASKANLTIKGPESGEFNLITDDYRCANDDFQVMVRPPGTLWDVPAGEHKAAADGYYGIIEPLDPGEYTMTIDAQVDEPFPFKQAVAWTSKVTYEFRVVGPQ